MCSDLSSNTRSSKLQGGISNGEIPLTEARWLVLAAHGFPGCLDFQTAHAVSYDLILITVDVEVDDLELNVCCEILTF